MFTNKQLIIKLGCTNVYKLALDNKSNNRIYDIITPSLISMYVGRTYARPKKLNWLMEA